jgi:two-component system, NarL family, sensor kinase
MSTIRYSYIIILISLIPSVCCAQTNKDTVVLQNLLTKARYYLNRNADSSYYFADKALKLSVKLSSIKHISIANQYLGRYYSGNEDFGKATGYFLEALKIEEKRKDEIRIADLNCDLGTIYFYLEKFDKSMQYNTKSLHIYEKFKDTFNIAKAIYFIGNLHNSREFCETRTKEQKTVDFNTAIRYYEKSAKLFEQIGNESGIAGDNVNIASVYNKLGKPENAYPYLIKALNYYKSVKHWNGVAGTLTTLGITYRRLKQYNKSIESFMESKKISQQKNLTGGIQFLYEEMAQTYDDAHDYKNARDYYVKYMTIRDSIYNAEKSKQIFELETKYQTERKEKAILGLLLEKKKKNQFIFILAAVILVLSLSGIYLFYAVRRKRIIAEQKLELKDQKILQLEKDRQIDAAHAVLKGEEKERGRLSRDLHDGLGGLLSVVKSKLTNMKGNYIISEESVNHFDNAINLLDNSIKELRRISHNMMPEALVKFGLKDALQDFCDQVSSDKKLAVNFNYFGETTRLESSLEITLYRITQELVNNTLKHAKATEILVQIVQETNRIHLTVQDNGQGFDPSGVDKFKSSGLQNIRARVESYNGLMDIDSKLGKGTEIGVEFEIDPTD